MSGVSVVFFLAVVVVVAHFDPLAIAIVALLVVLVRR